MPTMRRYAGIASRSFRAAAHCLEAALHERQLLADCRPIVKNQVHRIARSPETREQP
jgi:hypothetical protein